MSGPLLTGFNANPKPANKGRLFVIVGGAAATLLFSLIPREEGMEYRAYRDIAGVWTICAGDTYDVRAGQTETVAGCQKRLERQLIAHAEPVMACTPTLRKAGRDYQRAAAVSLAYNIGTNAYCKSSVARRFNAGDFKGACDAFLMWSKARVKGQLVEVRGLRLRRERERLICLRGVA